RVQRELAGVALSEEDKKAAESERLTLALTQQRGELMDWGAAVRNQFNDMQHNMSSLGYDHAAGEWVLWAGFLDTVLPMLASLGSNRSKAYLKRLQLELKTNDALEMWKNLHPASEGHEHLDDPASRLPVAPMPDGWTF